MLTSRLSSVQACQILVTIRATPRQLHESRHRMMLSGKHLVSVQLRNAIPLTKAKLLRLKVANERGIEYNLTFYNIFCFSRDFLCNKNCQFVPVNPVPPPSFPELVSNERKTSENQCIGFFRINLLISRPTFQSVHYKNDFVMGLPGLNLVCTSYTIVCLYFIIQILVIRIQ